MVVVAILSVTAAILAPRFLKHQSRVKQEECHDNLRSLFRMERDYFQKNGVFLTDLASLGWKPEGKGWYRYQFLPNPPPKNGFLFQCLGNIDKDSALDQATIDEMGQITQVTDDTKQ